jgi:hypothetical protein
VFTPPPAPWKSYKIVYITLAAILAYLVGGNKLVDSYYDFLATSFSAQLLLGIWSLFIGHSVVLGALFSTFVRHLTTLKWIAVLALSTAIELSLLILLLMAAVTFEQTWNGLTRGPFYREGIVQETRQVVDPRAGRLYSVTVDGISYEVLDSTWFDTIEKGENLTFAYHSTFLFDFAFSPDNILPTAKAGILFLIGMYLWVLTAIPIAKGIIFLVRKIPSIKNYLVLSVDTSR